LKNTPASGTILGIETIDLNGRGGLSNPNHRERKENKDREGEQEFSHGYSLQLGHPQKRLIASSAFPIG
jgi:hypothetical protein